MLKKYNTEPTVEVGIMRENEIKFSFLGDFKQENSESILNGDFSVSFCNGKILFNSISYDTLVFTPLSDSNTFELKNVTIGINFHWQRQENQQFKGAIKFIVLDGKIQAINIIHVEDYLTSVISSEMNATSDLELLKAHAIISRSWLLNKLVNKKKDLPPTSFTDVAEDGTQRLIRWYDQQDHTHFDVCADDHCQRYQGCTKANTEAVKQAIASTYGQVLTFNNKICDARFYKSCGGATEYFENCWDASKHYPYLVPIADGENLDISNLDDETAAKKWILSSPKAYCNTRDKKVLSQVLNNYDQETPDFFRWTVYYTQQELSNLVKEKSQIDFGNITDLIPLKRGASGRIIELKIVGDKKSMIVGKELEIRKWLSTSHLYSSAFIVEKTENNGQISFTLKGAGWGHGVGLCQIGAAMMAHLGIDYHTILAHYYPNSTIEALYEN